MAIVLFQIFVIIISILAVAGINKEVGRPAKDKLTARDIELNTQPKRLPRPLLFFITGLLSASVYSVLLQGVTDFSLLHFGLSFLAGMGGHAFFRQVMSPTSAFWASGNYNIAWGVPKDWIARLLKIKPAMFIMSSRYRINYGLKAGAVRGQAILVMSLILTPITGWIAIPVGIILGCTYGWIHRLASDRKNNILDRGRAEYLAGGLLVAPAFIIPLILKNIV